MKKIYLLLLSGMICAVCNALPPPTLILKEKPKEKYENPCAKVINNTLTSILKNPRHRCFGNETYRSWSIFFDWAVWGYLSGDSDFCRNESLIPLISEWMDHQLEFWKTPPDNEEKKKKWKENTMEPWTFHLYAIPLAEVKKDRTLSGKIGETRLAAYEKVIMKNLLQIRKNFQRTLNSEKNYLNMVHHQVPAMAAGYLLTGDRSYLEECEPLLKEQLKQLMPNGSFPYRLKIYGENHYETDFGYYHAVDVRAAYLLWTLGKSKQAKQMLQRSVSYYPLNIEPGGHTNDASAIWWKDQWRNWWPHHIAMTAVVAEDGENAAMALQLRNLDYFDNVIGAHAFRILAEKQIPLKEQRNNYLMDDPDIRGWRSRFLQKDGSTFSATVTTSPNSYTKASAMLTDKNKMTALHHARMMFRRTPISYRPQPFDPNLFNVTSRNGVRSAAEFRIGNFAAIGINDAIALCGETWRKNGQTLWDGKHHELWLITPNGMVGLLASTLEKNRSGAEFAHEYKLIARNVQWLKNSAEADNRIVLRLWSHNFPFTVHEKTRRYVYDVSSKRPDFQWTLTDRDRLPEEELQSVKTNVKRPEMKTYAAGTEYFSLISFSPLQNPIRNAVLLSHKKLLAFYIQLQNDDSCLAAYNPSEREESLDFKGQKYSVASEKVFLKLFPRNIP